MQVNKSELSQRVRKVGGSQVRISPAFVAAQQERDARLQRALGIRPEDVAEVNKYTADTVFIVVDLYVRKGVDTKPDGVGISAPGSGLAFNVPVREIVEVVEY